MPDQEWYWREQQEARAQLRRRLRLPRTRAFISIPAELAQRLRDTADTRERHLRQNPPPDEPLTADGFEWQGWCVLDRRRIEIERTVAGEIDALPPFDEEAVRILIASLKARVDAHYPKWPWEIYNSLLVQVGGWLLPQAVEPNEESCTEGYTHMAPHIAARIAALAERGLLVLAESSGGPPSELYAPLFEETPRRPAAPSSRHADADVGHMEHVQRPGDEPIPAR